MPSTRVSYGLPAPTQQRIDTSSTLPAAHRQVRRHSHIVAVQLPNTLFGPLSCMPQVDWGLRTVTIMSGLETIMQETLPRQVAMAPQEAGRATPATRFVLTCFITYVKTQREVYNRFPTICHNIYSSYITPSLYDIQYYHDS